LLAYMEEYGDFRVPQAYVTPDGVNLGTWVNHQRKWLSPSIDKEGKVKVGTEAFI
jgi:Helicase associated domain